MWCAPVKYEDISEIQQANKQADLIELQLDKFSPTDLAKLRKLCIKPVIFKLNALDWEALAHLPEFVDLPHTVSPKEFGALKKRFPQIKRICSYHDFEKTGDLEEIYRSLQSHPAEIYKIASYACTTQDALRMLHFVKSQRCLGICMGENGIITRILAPLFGVPWTYAPLSENHRTAPGQLLLKELEEEYRIRSHSSKTALYALIGDPVNQSKSHIRHNLAFKKAAPGCCLCKNENISRGAGKLLSLLSLIGI